jgi:4-diphosphocytidyl-2-C-methyl-D-erythritol kinase
MKIRPATAQIEKMILKTPAKVNLFLGIHGRRSDGFHELETIMAPIALLDQLELQRRPAGSGLTLQVAAAADLAGGPVPASKANLVWQAAELFGNHYLGCLPDVALTLTKTIPAAAGLGGGSSDAAATLIGLAQMFLEESRPDLSPLAARLGSDVTFFLEPKLTHWGGRGEICLKSYPGLPRLVLALIVPRHLALATPWVYQHYRAAPFPAEPLARLECFLAGMGQEADLSAGLWNDLEGVVDAHYPLIRSIRQQLLAAGARSALMSGSGSAVFGVFDNSATAAKAVGGFSAGVFWGKVVETGGDNRRDDILRSKPLNLRR